MLVSQLLNHEIYEKRGNQKLKDFAKKHELGSIIIAFVFLLLLNSCDYINYATNKSDYTKMTGTVIEKYTRRYGTGRRSSVVQYLEVSFTYEGEEYIVEGLDANFWETEGSSIDFYISSDGTVTRGAFVIGLNDFFLYVILLIYGVMTLWKKRESIFHQPQPSVGTIVDDYDFTSNTAPNTSDSGNGIYGNTTIGTTNLGNTMSENTATSTANLGNTMSANTAMDTASFRNTISGNAEPVIPISTQSQTTSYQEPEVANASKEFTNTSDSDRTQQQASFYDIPVISIPDEYQQ